MDRNVPENIKNQLLNRITNFLSSESSTIHEEISSIKSEIQILNLKLNNEISYSSHEQILKEISRFDKLITKSETKWKKSQIPVNTRLDYALAEINEHMNISIQSKESECDLKKHIKEYLKKDESNVDKLNKLKTKHQNLLKKIKEIFEKQEPYLYQKLMGTITTEMKLYANKAVAIELRKQINANNQWKQSVTNRMDNRSSLSQINSLFSQNLTLLKQIKARKILNNDKIFEESKNLELTIEKLKEVPKLLDKYKSTLSIKSKKTQQTYQISSIEDSNNFRNPHNILLNQLENSIRIIESNLTNSENMVIDLLPTNNNSKLKNVQNDFAKLCQKFNLLKKQIEVRI